MGLVTIEIDVGPEWGRVIKALAHQGNTLQKDLDQAIYGAANQTAAMVVMPKALEIPALTGQHTGVRKRLLMGVRVQKRGLGRGVRITTHMPEDEVALPRGFDSPDTGWTHPVFGREPRVRQFPGTADGWFREPISDDAPRFEDACERVLEDAAIVVASMGI